MKLANTTTYTGRSLDIETGLYYYRNRYYHAQLGRFVARDPIGYWGGDCNLFRYTYSNPILSRDPLGLDPGQFGPGWETYSLKPFYVPPPNYAKPGPDRAALLRDAAAAGLSAEVNDVLMRVDRIPHPGSRFDIRVKLRNEELKKRNSPIDGVCGLWTLDAACALSGSKCDLSDKIDINTANLQKCNEPSHAQNQNCIVIKFDVNGKPVRYYLDDGDVGGTDRVFTHAYAQWWVGNGEGAYLHDCTTTGYFDNNEEKMSEEDLIKMWGKDELDRMRNEGL